MRNALTLDLEYWWCSEYLRHVDPSREQDLLQQSLQPVLEMLDRHGARITFFVLGQIAEEHPGLIRDIRRRGHEIASHGYSHRLISELGRHGFELDVKKSIQAIKAAAGARPVGFRASNFSLNRETAWALPILQRLGFRYDSSIFPVSRRLTRIYGEPSVPLGPYYPSPEDITRPGPAGRGRIMEFPLTVYRLLGVNVPAAGGFYLRFWPGWFMRRAIRSANKNGRPAILYIHSWEFLPDLPRRELSRIAGFKRRCGLGSVRGKVETLLKDFEFTPLKELANR